jgi:guanylate kinase
MSGGRIIVISGPSGVGKTTLYKRLLHEHPQQLSLSVSATTRNPRPDEKEGMDYYFISKKEFQKKIEKNEFVEWAIVYRNLYGTLKSEIIRIIDEGKNCLLDVDVQGGMSIKRAFPDSHMIFITPPNVSELKKRIMKRNADNPDVMKIRLENAISEMNYKSFYDYNIINKDLEKAYRELKILVLKIIE